MTFYFPLPVRRTAAGREAMRNERVDDDEGRDTGAPTCIAGDILLSWGREGFGEFVNLVLD